MSTEAIDKAVVALRSFVHLSGALRAQALLAADEPVLVSCTRLGPIEVLGEDRSEELPHDAAFDAPAPDLGDLRPLPPFEVSAERGEVAGMIGGLDMVLDAVRALAAWLGDGATVVVELETTDPATPLGLSVRGGETVVVIGEDEFEVGG